LTDDPAEIDICAEVGTKSDRADFGGVGRSKSLEDTPGDTTKNFWTESVKERETMCSESYQQREEFGCCERRMG
jgi:hypothetical protein